MPNTIPKNIDLEKSFCSSVDHYAANKPLQCTIAPLEEQCHNFIKKNVHFQLCPQEVCLRPYLPSYLVE
jgi:hypothetical protein